MLNDQQVEILKMIIERKNTPIDLISDQIFCGNRESAVKSINELESQRIIEYPVVNMIRITPDGINLLRKS